MIFINCSCFGNGLKSYYKRQKEAIERNHIEGKFDYGKNGYNLNKIRARLKSTSKS